MAEAPTRTAATIPAEMDADEAFETVTIEQAAAILFTNNLDYVRGIIESGELVAFEDLHGNRRLYREVVVTYARYRKAVTRAGLREMRDLGDELGLGEIDYSFLLEDEEDEAT